MEVAEGVDGAVEDRIGFWSAWARLAIGSGPENWKHMGTDSHVFWILLSMTLLDALGSVLLDSPNKGGTTGVGFLLPFYRITFVDQDFPSWPTCLDLPRLAQTCLALLPIACGPGFPVVAYLPRLA